MRTLDVLLGEAPALAGLSHEHRATLAACAYNHVYSAGEAVLREGEPADAFHVLRRGTVAIETHVPGRGPVRLETLHDGDVLGWSWLVPPYRTSFDARALRTTRVVSVDGACLRARCETDPALGYALLRLLAAVWVSRLEDARLRLLDMYGKGPHG